MSASPHMNSTADRYAVVLRALREHHRNTRSWQATAAQLAELIPDMNARSIARTLHGLVDSNLAWSSHIFAKQMRNRRVTMGGRRFIVESDLNRPALYSTSRLGNLVNEMLDLVGDRSAA